MAIVEIVDQSLRDGQQSLWGMKMRAGHILPVADRIDGAGYHIVDLTGSSIFEVLVRQVRENPWEGLDLVRAALPHSTLRAGTRSNGVVGMGLTPDAIVELWVRTLAAHGIDSLWIFDCLFNLEQMAWVASVAADAGLTGSPQINFTESPLHTDDFYEDVALAVAKWENLDSIILGDEAGVLSNERARSWIPTIRRSVNLDVPMEMHFHNTTGVGTLNHLTGVEAGVTILHTAVSTLANGPSMPSTEAAIDNVLRLGHEVRVNGEDVRELTEWFGRLADANGYPRGAAAEYRVAMYQQQLPGGMMGTLLNQLRTYGMEDRLPAVLEECAVVRAEMGYPIMATPFSQFVGIQALLNVVNGERYSMIPDENLMYLAGHFGPPPGPIDPEVLDRAFSTPRGREFQTWTRPQPTLAEIRHAYGENLSDEELLLRYLMPAEDVDAMYAAGPVQRALPPDPDPAPEIAWVKEIMTNSTARSVHVSQGDVSVQLSR